MAYFWIDFEGSVCIEAENEDKAKENFYSVMADNHIDYSEIDTIERADEDENE